MRRIRVVYLLIVGIILALGGIGWQLLPDWTIADKGNWGFYAAAVAGVLVFAASLAALVKRAPAEPESGPAIPITRAGSSAPAVERARAGWAGEDRLEEEVYKIPPTMADPPAPGYVTRRMEYDEVIQGLLDPFGSGIVGITSALRGAGGYGKTTLAQAVCQDRRIWKAFPDGILWVTLGESVVQSDYAAGLGGLIEFIEGRRPEAAEVWAAKAHLREILKERQALLVIDDARRRSDIDLFLQPGSRTACLVTTRYDEILPPGTYKVRADEMRRGEAAALLSSRLMKAGLPGTELRDLMEDFFSLADRCGDWPLLLNVVSAHLADLIVQGSPVAEALALANQAFDRLGLAGFDSRDSPGRSRAAAAVLGASVERLEPDQQRRFEALAVFAGGADIPLAALEVLWGAGSPGEVEALCELLYRCSLLQKFDPQARMAGLHAVVWEFLVERQGDQMPHLHRAFLEGYRQRCPGEKWSRGPRDGYFFRRLAYHLAAAGQVQELEDLLVDLSWIDAHLRSGGIHELLDDYEIGQRAGRAQRDETRLVQGALLLASSVLAQDPDQLAPQLFGRLAAAEQEVPFEQAEIHQRNFLFRLLAGAQDWDVPVWLRPVRACFPAPGGTQVRTLAGHAGPVIAFAITPDGSRVVSGSEDKTIKVWDLESGQQIYSLEGHALPVTAVAISPDGRRVISGSADHTLKVWSLDSGQALYSLKVHNGLVATIVVTPDGRRALSVSNEYTLSKALKLWDLATGQLLDEIKTHFKPITVLVLTPDGRRVVTGSEDKTVKVWELKTGRLLHSLDGHYEAVQTLAVTPNGRRLVSGSTDKTLKVWDLEEGRLIHSLEGHTEPVTASAISPDGRRLVSASADRTLKVWDLASGRLIHTLTGHSGAVQAVAVTPDGRLAASASADSTLKLWDLEEGRMVQAFEGHTQAVHRVSITPDGRRAVSASEDWMLKVWELHSGQPTRPQARHAGAVTALAVTPDSRRAVSGSADKTLKVWDLESGRLLHTLKGHGGEILDVAISTNGRRVISTARDKVIYLWTLESGRLAHTMRGHPGWVRAAFVRLAGQQVVSCLVDGTLRTWELETGRPLGQPTGHPGPVTAIAITPGGERAITSCEAALRVWDLEKSELACSLANPSTQVGVIAISTDGRRALSGAGGSLIQVWDLHEGRRTHNLAGHTGPVRCAAVSPDGRLAVSGSEDSMLKVWDLNSGALRTSLDLNGPVTACAVSRDGKYVVAGGLAGEVYILVFEGKGLSTDR